MRASQFQKWTRAQIGSRIINLQLQPTARAKPQRAFCSARAAAAAAQSPPDKERPADFKAGESRASSPLPAALFVVVSTGQPTSATSVCVCVVGFARPLKCKCHCAKRSANKSEIGRPVFSLSVYFVLAPLSVRSQHTKARRKRQTRDSHLSSFRVRLRALIGAAHQLES